MVNSDKWWECNYDGDWVSIITTPRSGSSDKKGYPEFAEFIGREIPMLRVEDSTGEILVGRVFRILRSLDDLL